MEEKKFDHTETFCTIAANSKAMINLVVMAQHAPARKWYHEVRLFADFMINGEDEVRREAFEDEKTILPKMFVGDLSKEKLADKLADAITMMILRTGDIEPEDLITIVKSINTVYPSESLTDNPIYSD